MLALYTRHIYAAILRRMKQRLQKLEINLYTTGIYDDYFRYDLFP